MPILIIINQATILPMASPYAIRSRRTNSFLDIQPLNHQKLSMTPQTSSCQRRASGHSEQRLIRSSEKPHLVAPPPLPNQKSNCKNFYNGQKNSKSEPSSSSVNEQSNEERGCRKSLDEGQRCNNNGFQSALDLNCLPKLPEFNCKRVSDEVENNFFNEKKSYRNQYNRQIFCVPYRKCHSTMEEKVVTLINKINSGKDCQKQIDALFDRAKKASSKDLGNKFFISGMHIIYKLLAKEKLIHGESLLKMEDCLNQLKQRIQEELDYTQAYEIPQQPQVILTECKDKIVKRVYNILRKKMKNTGKDKIQRKAIETTNWFLECGSGDFQLLCERLATL